MFDPSKARHAANTARALHAADPAKRDASLAGLMAETLVALRQERGAVTEQQIFDCGFTADELARLRGRASDLAAEMWHGHDLLEAAA